MPPNRYRSVLFDLYGAFVRGMGGWIAIFDLVALAGPLGVDEQAVRSSVSRLSRKGLFLREVRGGQVERRERARAGPSSPSLTPAGGRRPAPAISRARAGRAARRARGRPC